jgi:ribosomal protein S18 acetylase RimI-like enzyme
MSDRTPVLLSPQLVEIDSPEFRAISDWPFRDPYVTRLLREDIPQRALFNRCKVWIYRNPGGDLVGFGTIEVSDEYRTYANHDRHPYLPLLAVNPTIPSLGYGTSILRHLTGEATLLASYPDSRCSDLFFLDVYQDNDKAIKLYTDNGFQQISPIPIPDPDEGKRPYIVMARRVSIAQA